MDLVVDNYFTSVFKFATDAVHSFFRNNITFGITLVQGSRGIRDSQEGKQTLAMWRNMEEGRRKETTKNEARKYTFRKSQTKNKRAV